MAVLYPAGVDFCIEDVSILLVAYVLLYLELVLGGNHALVEAELLEGAVVPVKEREQ